MKNHSKNHIILFNQLFVNYEEKNFVNQQDKQYQRMVKLHLILDVLAYLEHNFTMTRLTSIKQNTFNQEHGY